MKKWLLILIVLAAVFIFAAYVIIPDKITISPVELVKANPHGAYRCLTEKDNWKKIFGNEVFENSFEYNKTTFTLNKQLIDGIEVLIKEKDVSDSSVIELVRLNDDSSVIRWTVALETNSNPFKKFAQYFEANAMKSRITAALDTIKRFLEKEENIYGISVNRTTVIDTLLIATKTVYKNYPSTPDIYSSIRMLQNYARMNDAIESGYPMLNIQMTDSTNFEMMVALPVNKELNDHGIILHKEMVAGNILVTEVQGGPHTVSKAFNSLQDYVTDRDLQSPAIPFQSLITDRSLEPDTTKWVTKIYYPIY